MKQYNPDAKCPKCGNGVTNDKYREKERCATPDDITDVTVTLEHIERTCLNCGYSWDELPLDEEKP